MPIYIDEQDKSMLDQIFISNLYSGRMIAEDMNISDNSITTAKIVNDAVTEEKLSAAVRTKLNGGGGGGAIPDWNQNNSIANDYIKNRPMYVEVGPTQTATFDDEEFDAGKFDIDLYKEEFESEFFGGESLTLTINVDGGQPIVKSDTVKSTSIAGISTYYIGNLYMIGIGEDTGEDYVMWFMVGEAAKSIADTEFYGIYRQSDELVTVTSIDISFNSVVIHKLDKSYIPDLDYLTKSPASIGNPGFIVGNNVSVDSQYAINVIVDDNLALSAVYNPDRHNEGVFIVNSGIDKKFGAICLYDGSSVGIGVPYQDSVGTYTTYSYSSNDRKFTITEPYSPQITGINEFAIELSFNNYYEFENTFNYFIIGTATDESESIYVKSFVPKSATQCRSCGGKIDYDDEFYSSKFNEINENLSELISKYLSEGISLKLHTVLTPYCGLYNVIIGVNSGVRADSYNNENTFGTVLIGCNATVDGTSIDDSIDNVAIGDSTHLYKSSGNNGKCSENIVIGARSSATGKNNIVIGTSSDSSNTIEDNKVIIGNGITIGNNKVNIADLLKIDSNNNLELTNGDAVIIKSSTPCSSKKFKLTVDDGGTIHTEEV